MRRSQIGPLLVAIVPCVAVLFVGLACSEAEPTSKQEPSEMPAEPTEMPRALEEWSDYTTETESYRITLRAGPNVTMDVMKMGATMTTVDQGQAVNHHFEVHIFEKGSGAEVKDLVPTVRITDPVTKDSREFAASLHPSGQVPYVTACLLSNHRVKQPHFGDNLYLRDGTYTVTVGVGSDSAVFENVGLTPTTPPGV